MGCASRCPTTVRGFPLRCVTSIFERGSRHRDSPGQGLGLAIARELMHELGGRLSLADRSEGGARFDLLVPSLVMDGAA